MKTYFNASFLKVKIQKDSSQIYRALVKYGYSNFSLEILEYCDPSEAISREQGGKMAKLVWPFFRLILIS